MFYTYAHYTPDGKLFYIGKGHGLRAYRYSGRNPHYKNIVTKYGKPTVKIIAEWETEEDAFNHEIELIAKYRNEGIELCNKTIGGEGTSGYHLTETHKLKIKISKLGKSATWNIGKKHSEETKRKCGIVNLGRPASEKQRKIASVLFKGNNYAAGNTAQRKWIWVGTHIKTGEVVKFTGEKEMKLAGLQHSNIIKCLNGQRKSHKGYIWSREAWSNA